MGGSNVDVTTETSSTKTLRDDTTSADGTTGPGAISSMYPSSHHSYGLTLLIVSCESLFSSFGFDCDATTDDVDQSKIGIYIVRLLLVCHVCV